jgi:ABC-type Na+ transport system ATPase subunit NatA
VVLFSSHELETVERVCSHIVILHRGRSSPTIPSSACAR